MVVAGELELEARDVPLDGVRVLRFNAVDKEEHQQSGRDETALLQYFRHGDCGNDDNLKEADRVCPEPSR